MRRLLRSILYAANGESAFASSVYTGDQAQTDRFLNLQRLGYFLNKLMDAFVSKEEGKTLSSNDFTDEYVQKISDLESKVQALEQTVKDCVAIQDETV